MKFKDFRIIVFNDLRNSSQKSFIALSIYKFEIITPALATIYSNIAQGLSHILFNFQLQSVKNDMIMSIYK